MEKQESHFNRMMCWGLVLVLAGLIGLVIQVVPAWSAESTAAATGLGESGDNSGSQVPAAAQTKQKNDKVIFRYQDDDFISVAVTGSFNNWQRDALVLDPQAKVWALTVFLVPGNHSYQFIVEDGEGEWQAIDPSNLAARKDADHGWVSSVAIAGDGQGDDPLEDDDDNDRTVKIEFSLGGEDDDEEENWEESKQYFVRRELERLYNNRGDNVSYQRVDGFSLFFRPQMTSSEDLGPSVKGLFSYGFRSQDWTLGGSLIQPLMPNRRLMFRASGFSGTDHQDNTGIGGVENSLASVFFGEDYRDYYSREGMTLSLVTYPVSALRLEAGYESSEYSCLEKQENWSLGGDFIENPAIDEGYLRSYFVKAAVGTRYNHFKATYESGRNKEGDRFDYSLLKTVYRGRLRMSKARYFDFRAMYATGLSGEIPMQRRFPVGGLGTVRGYFYQSLLVRDPDPAAYSPAKGGQRMLVANFEYAFSFKTGIMWKNDNWEGDWDDDLGAIPGWEDIEIDPSFFLFFDTGMAWQDRSAVLDLKDLKSSAGVGFQFSGNGPRFDFIWTLDNGGHDTLFQLRLERMF